APLRETLARAGAPEAAHLGTDEARTGLQLDVRRQARLGAVENDGLLRQPLADAILGDPQRLRHGSLPAAAAIPLAGTRRGQQRMRERSDLDRDVQHVATDDAGRRM